MSLPPDAPNCITVAKQLRQPRAGGLPVPMTEDQISLSAIGARMNPTWSGAQDVEGPKLSFGAAEEGWDDLWRKDGLTAPPPSMSYAIATLPAT